MNFIWMDCVDAVASMLYLDYSRKSGEWLPNKLAGGKISMQSILRDLNIMVHEEFPRVNHCGRIDCLASSITSNLCRWLRFSMKWNMDG